MTRNRMIIYLLCLCLLSACGTTIIPPPGNPSILHSCNAVGKTHTLIASPPAVQGDWPMFHGDLKRDGATTTSSSNHLTEVWSYCTGTSILSSPVISAGVIYIGSTGGVLTALDARTGHFLWKFQADGEVDSTSTIWNGSIYFGSSAGFVYAINVATGYLQWRSSVDGTGAKVWSSPAVIDGLVIVGVASALNETPKVAGEILAFDAAHGIRRWRTWIMPNGATGGGVWSSPAIDVTHNVMYVGTGDPDDGVQAFDLHDGHLIWHWRAVSRDVSDTDVGSGPMLYTDSSGIMRVAVGGKDGSIYSLNAQNGQLFWHTHVADHIYGSPAFAHGTIYGTGTVKGNALSFALDANTGKVLWQHAIPVIVYSSPVVASATVYVSIGNGFSDQDGGVEVLNGTNGQLVQYVDLQSAATSSPAVLPSWLFVGAHDGNLYAFVR